MLTRDLLPLNLSHCPCCPSPCCYLPPPHAWCLPFAPLPTLTLSMLPFTSACTLCGPSPPFFTLPSPCCCLPPPMLGAFPLRPPWPCYISMLLLPSPC